VAAGRVIAATAFISAAGRSLGLPRRPAGRTTLRFRETAFEIKRLFTGRECVLLPAVAAVERLVAHFSWNSMSCPRTTRAKRKIEMADPAKRYRQIAVQSGSDGSGRSEIIRNPSYRMDELLSTDLMEN